MGTIARFIRTSDRITTEQKRMVPSQLLDLLEHERATFDDMPRTVGEAADVCGVTLERMLELSGRAGASDARPDDPYLVDLEAWAARCDKAVVALQEAVAKMDGE
ncbi:MAG: hypothetical protein ACYTFO_05435 [Planctomycetota bacterium]|jgi:hypothetical protein